MACFLTGGERENGVGGGKERAHLSTHNSIFVPHLLTFLMLVSNPSAKNPNQGDRSVPWLLSQGRVLSPLCVQTAEQPKFDFCLDFLSSLGMNLFLELCNLTYIILRLPTPKFAWPKQATCV